MTSVLFVCTGNLYRSPVAAEMFRQLLRQDPARSHWEVDSAGTWTTNGRAAPSDAALAARSLGLDISNHRAKMLDRQMIEAANLILVMSSNHLEALQVEFPFARSKIFLLAQAAQGMSYDIPDPAEFERETTLILREMTDMIERGYENICRAATF
ncbi:MAG: low molecular weight protein arginine phosphatase [Anaerolineales bacterium]